MIELAPKDLGKTIGIAGIAAAVLLVLFVLPAEFGADPTGFGKALGLTGLAPSDANASTGRLDDLNEDVFELSLEPFESLEVKYVAIDGAGIMFEWVANGPLTYDLHAEPHGADESFAVSYAKGKKQSDAGHLITEFDGEHGWFWENREGDPITLSLTTTGFYSARVLYRDGGRIETSFVSDPPSATTNEGASP
ncbi:MAG: hypothetical protein AAGH38_05955 [Pseudomonadota bacterium]